MNARQRLLAILSVLVLVLLIGGLFRRMHRSQRTAMTAYDNLSLSRELAEKLGNLQQRPAVASGYESLPSEANARIERAAKTAGVPVSSLKKITPQAKQRIENSSYAKKPMQVSVKHISMQQLIAMLYALQTSEPPLRPESVVLTAPDAKDNSDAWNVELTLTYWIYEPREPKEL